MRQWIRFALAAVYLAASAASAVGPMDDRRPAPATPVTIRHPGGLHTPEQLAFVLAKVRAGEEPWRSAHRRLIEIADGVLAQPPEDRASPPEKFTVPGFLFDPEAHAKAQAGMACDAFDAYTLALAHHLTLDPDRREDYAARAVGLLMPWTRCTAWGEQDTDLSAAYGGHRLLVAADLLHDFTPWTVEDRARFRLWVKTVYRRCTAIRDDTNNRGAWGLLASMITAHYLDDEKTLAEDVRRLAKRIDTTITPDGRMPEELRRGDRSLWYTYFALAPTTEACLVAWNAAGADYFDPVTPRGRRVLSAFYLLYPALADPQQWTKVSPEKQVRTASPEGFGGNLAEAMASIYPGRGFDAFTRDHRPIVLSIQRHHHAWVYPTLFAESYGLTHPK